MSLEKHYIYSNLNLPPASMDLLISSLPAHLSCSSFRNRIRKANTAVVQLSTARHHIHSWRRGPFQLRPPSHWALEMEQIDFWIDKLFKKSSLVSLLSVYSACLQAFHSKTKQRPLSFLILFFSDCDFGDKNNKYQSKVSAFILKSDGSLSCQNLMRRLIPVTSVRLA